MCQWIGGAVLLALAVRLYSASPAHVTWKGMTLCEKGNTTLDWTLQQRHVDALSEGNTVLAHLRLDCTGDARLFWAHSTHVVCPVDLTTILTYPPNIDFETLYPQRVRGQLDMIRLHDVPKLTKWMTL